VFFSQPELDVKSLVLITKGPTGGDAKGKPTDENLVQFILGKLPRLVEVTLMFQKKDCGNLPLVADFAKAIQHIPSSGLVNVALRSNLLNEFKFLTQVQPLRLTKLEIQFQTVDSETL